VQGLERFHAGQVVPQRPDQRLHVLVRDRDTGNLRQRPHQVAIDLLRLHARILNSFSCGGVSSRGPVVVTSARSSVWYASWRASITAIGSMLSTIPDWRTWSLPGS